MGLCRLEAQQLLAPRSGRQKGGSAAAARQRRCRRMVGEGAYRKAVKAVSGQPAQLTAADEARFAADLLQASVRSDALCAIAPTATPPASRPFRGDGEDHPLKGVRYAALTAPGPSGTRPEHAKELLSCRSRRAGNRLCRAMLETQRKIREGDLIPSAAWLKRIFLRKPNSDTPRPIRMGEFLRGATAKRVQRQAAPKLRRACRSYHQWGVEMPGRWGGSCALARHCRGARHGRGHRACRGL
jgi:hypothetical protein